MNTEENRNKFLFPRSYVGRAILYIFSVPFAQILIHYIYSIVCFGVGAVRKYIGYCDGTIERPREYIYDSFMGEAYASVRSYLRHFVISQMENVYAYFDIIFTTGVFAFIAAACFLLARPFYFKAVSSTSEAGRTKKHKVRKHKKNNIVLTFFRKEIKLFFRNSQSVNSAVITVLMLPFLVYVFNYILLVINKNALGDFMSVAFNVMITINILSANNANVASAISSEGNEFAVLKTAPSNTSVICWAKIAVTACVNMVALVLTFIMFRLITTLSAVDLVLLAVLLVMTTMGHILWSFQLDINNPRILDYATKGNNVVDNVNIGKAVVIGFMVATLFGGLAFVLMLDNVASGWVRLLAIAAAFLAARIYLLRRNIKVYFNEIQM